MTDAYLNNDHTLTVSDLTHTAADGTVTLLTSATLTFAIYDTDDVLVAGSEGTLSQVGTSNEYTAEIDATIMNLLTKGGEYYISIPGVQSGFDFEFNIDILVKKRGRT